MLLVLELPLAKLIVNVYVPVGALVTVTLDGLLHVTDDRLTHCTPLWFTGPLRL